MYEYRWRERKKDIGCDLRGNGSEVESNRFLYWVFEVLILIAVEAEEENERREKRAAYAIE